MRIRGAGIGLKRAFVVLLAAAALIAGSGIRGGSSAFAEELTPLSEKEYYARTGTYSNTFLIQDDEGWKVAYCFNWDRPFLNSDSDAVEKFKYHKIPNANSSDLNKYAGLRESDDYSIWNGRTDFDDDPTLRSNVLAAVYYGYPNNGGYALDSTDGVFRKSGLYDCTTSDTGGYPVEYLFEIATQFAVWHIVDGAGYESMVNYTYHLGNGESASVFFGNCTQKLRTAFRKAFEMLTNQYPGLSLSAPEDYQLDLFVHDNYSEPYAYDSAGRRVPLQNLLSTRLPALNSAHSSLEISKTDQSDGSARLKGAEFTLYTDSACSRPVTLKYGKILKTGESGTVSLSTEDLPESLLPTAGSPAATYYLKETRSPEGYEVNGTVFQITVASNASGTKYTISCDGSPALTVPDKKKTEREETPASITVTKKDAADGAKLDGAVFSVYQEADCSGAAIAAVTTENGGTAVLSTDDLKNYLPDSGSKVFYLKETHAPAGYEITDTTVHPVTVGTSSTTALESGVFRTHVTHTMTIDGAAALTVSDRREATAISLRVTKVWNDGENADGIRPDTDTFKSWLKLYSIEEGQLGSAKKLVEGQEPEVTESEDGTYSIVYSGLPQYAADGKKLIYHVEEELPEGSAYQAVQGSAEDGGQLINRHTPQSGTRGILVQKRWSGVQGSQATIVLYADGREAGRVVLSEENHWRHVFEGLPLEDEEGNEIVYTVQEAEKDYHPTITGDAESGFLITNHPPIPNTADTSNVLPYAIAMVLSGLAVFLLIKRKKGRE